MSNPKVLIVGAGALGLTTGYYLQLAGAAISFLVRPHRVEALSRPQRLYSYGERDIKILESYQVFTSAGELQGQHFDFALVTLDGATCRSEQGTAMLTELGRALSGSGTTLLICGVGLGLYEHVKATTCFAAADLLEGTMTMFAYQVNAQGTPLPAAEDLELHNSADIAYLGFPDGDGFMVTSKPRRAAKAFAGLYDRCGIATCKRAPGGLYAMGTNMFYAFTVASELDDWQGTDALISNKELWELCCSSQREIMGLKQHGLIGKLAGRWVSDNLLGKKMRESERNAGAMGFTEFNRFHHGGKVLEQDIQILENCAAQGEREGRSMSATNSLLERWRKSRG